MQNIILPAVRCIEDLQNEVAICYEALEESGVDVDEILEPYRDCEEDV